jgi:hypothetical protein
LLKNNLFVPFFHKNLVKTRIVVHSTTLKKITRVGTYVQRGSKFCFVVVLLVVGVTDIAQNTALLSNFTMLSAYCTIACTFARQPCPAALPGSLARQPCPAALPGRLARQPCTVAFAWQPCPVALPASLARQPCRKVCKPYLIYGRMPASCSIAYFYSAGS